MENASKALIMAGSVLLAIMIIGLLVFGYNQISETEQIKSDSENIDKLAEYMARFEQFNRDKSNALYGSELLSLANLQEDYNESNLRIDEGYDKIEIKVEITKSLDKYLKAGKTYDISEILEKINQVLGEIDKYENIENKNCIKYNGKTVRYYSKKSYREIAKEFGLEDNIPSNWGNDLVSEFLINDSKTKQLMIDLDTYDNLKNTVYNQFRTEKRFYCKNVDYNEFNGRIKSMIFSEI